MRRLLSGAFVMTGPNPSRRRGRLAPAPVRAETLESRTLLSFGSLDPAFGAGGRVTTDFVASAGDRPRQVALQDDGKLLEVAWHGGFSVGEPTLSVTRFNADGTPDASFGAGGIALVDFPGRGELLGSIAVAPGGKIAIGTWSFSPATDFLGADSDVSVAVLNPDGSFDTTFDGDGMKVFDVGRAAGGASAATTSDIVFDVAVQPDGKVVTAGNVFLANQGRVALTRLNVDGTLDATFGGTGVVTAPFANYGAGANAVTLDADGKILVAGPAGIPVNGRITNNEFAVARYNPDGTLDATFDGDGFAITSFTAANDTPNAIAVAPGGTIVVAGFATLASAQDIAVARYNPDGSPDASFSGDGKATVALTARNKAGQNVPTNEAAVGLAVQSDGAILVSGRNTAGAGVDLVAETFLVRLDPSSGLPDAAFGAAGKVVGALDEGSDVVVQPGDGSIILGGPLTTPTGGFEDFAAARYDPAGRADLSYGTTGSGIASADFPGSGFSSALGTVVQSDGKLVVAGYTVVSNGNFRDLAFARYNADGSLDATFGAGGRLQIDLAAAGYTNERVSALALDAQGRVVFAGDVFDPASQATHIVVGRLKAAGTLDADFGAGGMRVVRSFAGNPAGSELARDVLVQPDGRIVAVGEYSPTATTHEFAVLRLTEAGALDTTFAPDASGMFHTTVGGQDAGANAVALARDQFGGAGWDLVVAGRATISGISQFGFIRLNDDGWLDWQFGTSGGKFTLPVGTGNAVANAVAVDAQGYIVLGGSARVASPVNQFDNFALARYRPDAALDTTFGTGGKVLTDFALGNDAINSLLVMPDRSIYAGGLAASAASATTPGSLADFGLARYKASGVLDLAFGAGGKVLTNFTDGPTPGSPTIGRDAAARLALYPGDRLVAVGAAILPRTGSDFAAARYSLIDDNRPPVSAPGGPYTIDENSLLTLDGRGSADPDPGGAITSYEWDLNYDGTTFDVDQTGAQAPVLFPDGPLTRTVALRVTDIKSAQTVATTTIMVRNVAPVVDAGPNQSMDAGFRFLYFGTFTDPGADTWTVNVDYGDGGAPEAPVFFAKRVRLSHPYSLPGTYTVTVSVADDDGAVGTDSFVMTVGPGASHVGYRQLYYNHSGRDGNWPGGFQFAFNAAPLDKWALLPGQKATVANLSSYPKGINALYVSLDRILTRLSVDDFVFEVGDGTPGGWTPAPALTASEVAEDAGYIGTHAAFNWPDGSIRNKWLKVTVLANQDTLLAAPDVFYYGSLPGETEDRTSPGRISAADLARTRAAQVPGDTIFTNPYDHNRDFRVNALDTLEVRRNLLRSLRLITAPPVAPAGAAAPQPTAAASAPASVETRGVATDLLRDGA